MSFPGFKICIPFSLYTKTLKNLVKLKNAKTFRTSVGCPCYCARQERCVQCGTEWHCKLSDDGTNTAQVHSTQHTAVWCVDICQQHHHNKQCCRHAMWRHPTRPSDCQPEPEPRLTHCHVTCHPTQLKTPTLTPARQRRYSIYLPRSDGRLSWPWWLVNTEMVYLFADSHPSR